MSACRHSDRALAIAVVAVAAWVIALEQPASAAITRPYDLHQITSKSGCAVFVALLFGPATCDSTIRAGGVALVWKDHTKTLTGYKLYRVDSGRNDLVLTLSNGTAHSYAALPKTPGGFAGRCYDVVAYVGNMTSKPSDSFCITADLTSKNQTFAPENAQTLVMWNSIAGIDQCNNPISPGTVYAGVSKAWGKAFTAFFPWLKSLPPNESSIGGGSYWAYNNGTKAVGTPSKLFVGGEDAAFSLNSSAQSIFSYIGGCNHNWTEFGTASVNARTGARFPLTTLSGHKIYAATLTLSVGPTVRWQNRAYHITQPYSCVTSADIALDQWWTAGDSSVWGYNLSKAYFKVGAMRQVKTDVTSIVQTWTNNHDAGDYGFMLRTLVADPGVSHTSSACMTTYKNPRLDVVYF
jgi:hypothetical protein